MAANFFIRWLVSSVGLWIAALVLSDHISLGNSIWTVIAAGFILAVLNLLLKPLFVVLSLPALILTLGLFMIVVNGFLVYLASLLYTPLHITNFWAAVFAGMVIGLVNYIVTALLQE
jgi:putative membrane protein